MNRTVHNRALCSQRSTTASPHTTQKGPLRTHRNRSLFVVERTDQRNNFPLTPSLNAKSTLTDSRKKNAIIQHLAVFWSNPQSFESSCSQNGGIHRPFPLLPQTSI